MSELEFYRFEYQKWIKENEAKGVSYCKENEKMVFSQRGVVVLKSE